MRERGSALSVDEVLRYALPGSTDDTAPARAANRLTRRERQVADLVAEGISSRQIADKLVIAVRTAEGHAKKILTKQVFTSRIQIASWFARQRAGDA
ncbi:response regulator transcription factor [Saccharopolyspora tripterygii]